MLVPTIYGNAQLSMKISLPISVVAFETDYAGVVSNTRYLEYMERGRYALLNAGGFKIEEMWAEHKVQPVVRRVEIDYFGFAKHEDALILDVAVGEHGKTSTTLLHTLRRDDAILMQARQILVYINTNWRPVRVPDFMKQAFPPAEAVTDSKK